MPPTCCKGLEDLYRDYSILSRDPTYGWVLSWIELTEEEGYTQIHKFGVSLKYCPMCGNPLKNN